MRHDATSSRAAGARGRALGACAILLFGAGQASAQRTGELMHRGDLMLRQGLPDEAAQAFQQAAEIDPANAEAIYNRGVAVLSRGDKTLAGDLFREADRVADNDALRARARYNLGVVLFQTARETVRDNPEEAMRTLRDSARAFRGSYRLEPDGRTLGNIEIVRRAEALVAEQLELRRNLNELAAEEQERQRELARAAQQEEQRQPDSEETEAEPPEEPLDERIDLPQGPQDLQDPPAEPETEDAEQQPGEQQPGQQQPGQDQTGQQSGEGQPGETPPGAMPSGPMDRPTGTPQDQQSPPSGQQPQQSPQPGPQASPQPGEPGGQAGEPGDPSSAPDTAGRQEQPPGPPPKPEPGQRDEGEGESPFEPQPWETPPSGAGGATPPDRQQSQERSEGAQPDRPEAGAESRPEGQPGTRSDVPPEPRGGVGGSPDAVPQEQERAAPGDQPPPDPDDFVGRARDLMERLQETMERAIESGFVVGDPEEMEEIARELRELQQEPPPPPPGEAVAERDGGEPGGDESPEDRLLAAMRELANRMAGSDGADAETARRDPVTDALLEQERRDRNLIRDYERRSLLGRPAQAERDW